MAVDEDGMTYTELIRWYKSQFKGSEDWGDFSDDDIAEVLDAVANNDGRVKKVNQDSRLLNPLTEDLEDDFIESVDTYQGYKNLNQNRSLTSGGRDRLKNRVSEEVSFDADDIREVNSQDKSLAYKIRSSVRNRGSTDVLRSLSDDEVLDDYLKVQRKKGSDYFLSSQGLVEEVNRRGLI